MVATNTAAGAHPAFLALMKKYHAVPMAPIPRKVKSALAPYDGKLLLIMSLTEKNLASVMTETSPNAADVQLNGKQAGVVRRAWEVINPDGQGKSGPPLGVRVVKENKEYKLTEF